MGLKNLLDKLLKRKYPTPEMVESVAEIRNAHINIHALIKLLTTRATAKSAIETVILIHHQNERIRVGLEILKEQGL